MRADARAADAPAPAAAAAASAAGSWLRGWRRRWRPLAGLAALCWSSPPSPATRSAAAAPAAAATTTVVAGKAPGVTAKMVERRRLRHAAARQRPAAAGDRVLEAWVQREGEVEPVEALFVPDREGTRSTTIADMNGVEVVMVTTEPEGGSEPPTSPIVTPLESRGSIRVLSARRSSRAQRP